MSFRGGALFFAKLLPIHVLAKGEGVVVALFNRYRADRLHRQAQACSRAGDEDAALALYAKCVVLDPGYASAFYNIGLIHKCRGEWENKSQSVLFRKVCSEPIVPFSDPLKRDRRLVAALRVRAADPCPVAAPDVPGPH